MSGDVKTVVVVDITATRHEFKADKFTKNGDGSVDVWDGERLVAQFMPGILGVYHVDALA